MTITYQTKAGTDMNTSDIQAIRASHTYYDPECDCEGCTAERDHFDATGRWVRDIAGGLTDDRPPVINLTDTTARSLSGMGFSRAEARRRLAHLAKLARAADRDIPGNGRMEVGSRTITVRSDTLPTRADAFPPGDDLHDFMDRDTAAADWNVTGPGKIVHLYFSQRSYGDWELVNVITGWMGTSKVSPQLLDVPGC